VTREGTRPFAALVVAVLAAALLAACGGSDSDSAGSTEPASTSGTTTSNTGARNGESDPDNSGGNSPQGDGKAGERSSARDAQTRNEQDSDRGSRPKDVETPLEVSGGGSEQFRSKGGDNSIQEYGEEGDESELREVAEIVHDFYVSRAEEDWEKACSYIAKSNIEQLEQLASQSSELKGAGCAPILKAFTRPLPAEIQREITTVDAGSFRREGEQGFLIYYGADRTVYAMPLREEDGSWKVGALSGTTLG
jgi:hypothetical protein